MMAAAILALIQRSESVGGEPASGIAVMWGTGATLAFRVSSSNESSHHILPAVRRQRRTGNQAGLVGGEEHDAARDLLRLAQATERDERQDVLLQHVLRYRPDHFGGDIAGADRVDGDTALGAFLRQRLGEAELAGLGGGIVGLPHLALLAVDRRDIDDAAELALAHA